MSDPATTMKTQRTEIDPPAPDPCAACPWLTSNHGKKHPGNYYSDANRRRLWKGLRTGDAPGMTCHPTDPENQPVKEEQRTRECTGAVVLMQRELNAFEEAVDMTTYRRGRSLAATREGLLSHAVAALPYPMGRGLAGTILNMAAPVSLGANLRREEQRP